MESPAIEDWIQRGVEDYKGEFYCRDRDVSCFIAVYENKEDKMGNIAEWVNQANVHEKRIQSWLGLLQDCVLFWVLLLEDFLTVRSCNHEDFYINYNGNRRAGDYDEEALIPPTLQWPTNSYEVKMFDALWPVRGTVNEDEERGVCRYLPLSWWERKHHRPMVANHACR